MVGPTRPWCPQDARAVDRPGPAAQDDVSVTARGPGAAAAAVGPDTARLPAARSKGRTLAGRPLGPRLRGRGRLSGAHHLSGVRRRRYVAQLYGPHVRRRDGALQIGFGT